jgi:ADP-ribosylglycohydrolase
MRQDRFLGALMGMAIGDALGMPVVGWSAEQIRDRYGGIDTFFPRTFPDGTKVSAGEFTDETEAALCVVESLTASGGEVDVANIGTRLLHLARSESRRWMSPQTLAALDEAEESLEFSRPLVDDIEATPDVLARGVPIGLLHSIGSFDSGGLTRDAEAVARVTHGSPLAIAGVTAVAYLTRLATRGETATGDWASETAAFLGQGAVADALGSADAGRNAQSIDASKALPNVIATALNSAVSATGFPEAVFSAVNLGGPADSRGALAGAVAGARQGVAGIPQPLIDGLEGRIYVSLAAPWFYRVAMQRAGLVVPLRLQ